MIRLDEKQKEKIRQKDEFINLEPKPDLESFKDEVKLMLYDNKVNGRWYGQKDLYEVVLYLLNEFKKMKEELKKNKNG